MKLSVDTIGFNLLRDKRNLLSLDNPSVSQERINEESLISKSIVINLILSS